MAGFYDIPKKEPLEQEYVGQTPGQASVSQRPIPIEGRGAPVISGQPRLTPGEGAPIEGEGGGVMGGRPGAAVGETKTPTRTALGGRMTGQMFGEVQRRGGLLSTTSLAPMKKRVRKEEFPSLKRFTGTRTLAAGDRRPNLGRFLDKRSKL